MNRPSRHAWTGRRSRSRLTAPYERPPHPSHHRADSPHLSLDASAQSRARFDLARRHERRPRVVSRPVAQSRRHRGAVYLAAHAFLAGALVALPAPPSAHTAVGSAAIDPRPVDPAAALASLRRHAHAARVVRRRRFLFAAGADAVVRAALGRAQAGDLDYRGLDSRLDRVSFLAAAAAVVPALGGGAARLRALAAGAGAARL